MGRFPRAVPRASARQTRRPSQRPGLDARGTRLVERSVEPLLDKALLPGQTQVFDLAVAHIALPMPPAVTARFPARQTCFCGVLRVLTRVSADDIGGRDGEQPSSAIARFEASPHRNPVRDSMLGSIHWGRNLFRAALFFADDGYVHIAQLRRYLSRRRDRRRVGIQSHEQLRSSTANGP